MGRRDGEREWEDSSLESQRLLELMAATYVAPGPVLAAFCLWGRIRREMTNWLLLMLPLRRTAHSSALKPARFAKNVPTPCVRRIEGDDAAFGNSSRARGRSVRFGRVIGTVAMQVNVSSSDGLPPSMGTTSSCTADPLCVSLRMMTN